MTNKERYETSAYTQRLDACNKAVDNAEMAEAFLVPGEDESAEFMTFVTADEEFNGGLDLPRSVDPEPVSLRDYVDGYTVAR